jgi:iron complex outermembrane recepter protein
LHCVGRGDAVRSRQTFASIIVLATFPALPVPAANAQASVDAATDGGEREILVTARRRNEALSETPTTLSVVEGSTLRDLHASDIQSIVALTPNATVERDPENLRRRNPDGDPDPQRILENNPIISK